MPADERPFESSSIGRLGRRGLTIFFTGLPGAGKSTIASALLRRLLDVSDRPVTLLDGDLIRRQLSPDLGFSKRDRNLNVHRVGRVAADITRRGGVAICASIAPYDEARKEARDAIEPLGGFVLVYVSTPLEVCERRDPKGLYAKARAGRLPHFTGISDPYEPPLDADVVVDTIDRGPQDAVDDIVSWLMRAGHLS